MCNYLVDVGRCATGYGAGLLQRRDQEGSCHRPQWSSLLPRCPALAFLEPLTVGQGVPGTSLTPSPEHHERLESQAPAFTCVSVPNS